MVSPVKAPTATMHMSLPRAPCSVPLGFLHSPHDPRSAAVPGVTLDGNIPCEALQQVSPVLKTGGRSHVSLAVLAPSSCPHLTPESVSGSTMAKDVSLSQSANGSQHKQSKGWVCGNKVPPRPGKVLQWQPVCES